MWRGLLAAGLVLWPVVCIFFFLVFLGVFLGTIFIGGFGLVTGLFLYGIYSILRDSGLSERLLGAWQSWRDRHYESMRENIEKSFTLEGDWSSAPSDKPVLYICHPHGLFSMTWFFHFGTKLTHWPSHLQKPKIAVHSLFFRIPVVRELIRFSGGIEATEECIMAALREGHSVAIILGGIEELTLSEPGDIRLVLKKRKGYARIAKRVGCPLIPLIALGENELFPLLRTPWLDWIQTRVRSWFSIVIPIPTWKSLQSWFQLAHGPLKTPIETWCLKPVFPERGVGVEKLREQYIRRLQEFAEQKGGIHIVA